MHSSLCIRGFIELNEGELVPADAVANRCQNQPFIEMVSWQCFVMLCVIQQVLSLTVLLTGL